MSQREEEKREDSEEEDWWDDDFFLPETVSEGSESKYDRFMNVSSAGRFITQEVSTAVDFLVTTQGAN